MTRPTNSEASSADLRAALAAQSHVVACGCDDCEADRNLDALRAREDDRKAREDRLAFTPAHPFAGLWG